MIEFGPYCVATCPHHSMPCEQESQHEMHKHRAMFGPLRMYCWWTESEESQ